MDHQINQNPSQEQHNQNKRRATEAGGGGQQGQNQLPHPPPQACPRCNSNNTKFCYYNNYSLAQPRYFCKGCRRYWTQGGTLRSVPVGGGSRKRKRPNSKMSSGTTSSSATAANTITGGRCLPMEQQPPFNFELTGGQLNSSTSTMSQNPTSLFGTPISTNANTLIYGGGGGGFFSSLTAFPPVNFGPNLRLLHGLGLPNLDHHHRGLPQHHQQQQHEQQEPTSFQQLLHQHHHQNLHPGSIPISAPSFSADWIITSNKSDDNSNNNNDNNDEDDPNHWPDFQVGNTDDGLEGP